MARPIKFKTKKQFKLVNRCIICGKVIPIGSAICSSCDRKRKDALKRFLRNRR